MTKRPSIFIDLEMISDVLSHQGNPDIFESSIGVLLGEGYIVAIGSGSAPQIIFKEQTEFHAWFNKFRGKGVDTAEPDGDEGDEQAEAMMRIRRMEEAGASSEETTNSPKRMDDAERAAGLREHD